LQPSLQHQLKSEREHLIDALRGFALFGILVVNIQSFAWGVGAPTMGVLWESSTWRDEWTIWLTSFIFEFKIYPVFCFCFGYGFAVMAKKWRHAGLDVQAVRLRFTRRINFMLCLGLFHGFFIWFGDILARYALTAYLLDKHIGKGPRQLLKPLRFWGVATIVVLFISILLNSLFATKLEQDYPQTVTSIIDAFYVYADGDYVDTITARFGDYGLVLFSWLFLFPQAVFLFISGAIVAQLGWLKSPLKHRAKWQRILVVSLVIGVPFAIIMANHSLAASHDPSVLPTTIVDIAMSFSLLLTPAYIAAFALTYTTAFGNIIVSLLAPMGRMALTNYLLQSMLMFALLLGAGLGLADVGQFTIALIAIGIYATQLAASHLYLQFFSVGPMESLWRRYTYWQPTKL
jgi:uncharacterized protein